jgi:hypothetical protein
VKLMISPQEQRQFDSGKTFTPQQFVAAVKAHTNGWKFDALSIGFPSPVRGGKIAQEPRHLGRAWVGFALARSLGKPVRVINDAAMQALGSYHGKRMLFLGLGTGLGATLIWPGAVLPLELGDLPYDFGILDPVLGMEGLQARGEREWKKLVLHCVKQLRIAFIADYVVLGGGNARLFAALPEGIERGHNRNAYTGGCRMWETDPKTRRPKWAVL